MHTWLSPPCLPTCLPACLLACSPARAVRHTISHHAHLRLPTESHPSPSAGCGYRLSSWLPSRSRHRHVAVLASLLLLHGDRLNPWGSPMIVLSGQTLLWIRREMQAIRAIPASLRLGQSLVKLGEAWSCTAGLSRSWSFQVPARLGWEALVSNVAIQRHRQAATAGRGSSPFTYPYRDPTG